MDETLFRSFNDAYQYAPPTWDFLGGTVVVGLLAIAVVLQAVLKKQSHWLLCAALAVGITDLVCARVVKPTVQRERPCQVLEGVTGPRSSVSGPFVCGSGASMPSNHAANTAALAAAMGSPALAGISVIAGVSRVVNGQHWPSDVLAGWAAGAVVGVALRAACAKAFGWQ